MITKLTTEKITDKCAGSLRTGAPCPATNEILLNSIYLGSSTIPLFKIGSILISAKTVGLTLTIIDSMTASSLSVSKLSNDISVNLESDGSTIKTTEKNLFDRLVSSMGSFLNISLLGSGSNIVSTKSKTSIPSPSPREEKNIDSMQMPVCTSCNGYLTNFRTWEDLPIDFPNYKQRAAINFIAKELKRMGYVHPSLKDTYAIELGIPTVILTDYPSGDGTL